MPTAQQQAVYDKQALAAAWALQQIGSRDWYNRCQTFIEQAYGTSGRYGSAAAAGDALNWGRDPSQADVGDLVFFRPDPSNGNAGHVGIYLGNGEMVGATNGGITRDNFLTNPYWKNLFVGFGDPPEQWQGRPSTNDLVAGAANLAGNVKSAAGNQPGAYQQWVTATYGAAAPYANELMSAAAKYDVPVNVLAGLLIQESGGKRDAVSRAGAQGLMQLMPGTARGLGVTDPFNPAQSIDGGARYLKQLADSHDGDWQWAVGAYNAGPAGNQNNAETRNHIVKVMAYADQIGAGMPSGAGAGGGFTGPDTRDPNRPGAQQPPEVRQGGNAQPVRPRQAPPTKGPPAAVTAIGDLLARIASWANPAVDPSTLPQGAAPVPPAGEPGGPGGPAGPPGPPEGQDQNQGPGVSSIPGGGTIVDDQGNPVDIRSLQPGQAPGTNVPPGTVVSGRGAGTPLSTYQMMNPADYAGNPGFQAVATSVNSILRSLEAAEKELASATSQGDKYLANQKVEALRADLVRLAPTLEQMDRYRKEEAAGQVVQGDAAYAPQIPIRVKDENGQWTIKYIPNPQAGTPPSVQSANIGAESNWNVANIQGATQRDVAGINAQSSANVAGINARSAANVANIQGATSRDVAQMSATTQRVTQALQSAVEQRRQDLDARIRGGELDLKAATEEWNQWYKTNVEAPLAILKSQQESATYQLNQSRAVTERATAADQSARGIAQLGQQAYQTAGQLYNTTLAQTAPAGWNAAYQANLQGGNTPYPTFNVNESMDQFATRKVAELLKGVSPYAAQVAAAGEQLGGNTPPPSGQAIGALTNQATNVLSGALGQGGPPGVSQYQPFQTPPPVDVAGLASVGSGLNPGQINDYIYPGQNQAAPPPRFGPNEGYGLG